MGVDQDDGDEVGTVIVARPGVAARSIHGPIQTATSYQRPGVQSSGPRRAASIARHWSTAA